MLFLKLHFLILSYYLDTNTKLLLPGHKRQAYQTYYLDKNVRFNKAIAWSKTPETITWTKCQAITWTKMPETITWTKRQDIMI